MMQRCKLKQLKLIEFFWQYIHSSIIVMCISSTVQHTPESPIWQKNHWALWAYTAVQTKNVKMKLCSSPLLSIIFISLYLVLFMMNPQSHFQMGDRSERHLGQFFLFLCGRQKWNITDTYQLYIHESCAKFAK